jgi:hypothetical protein
VPQELLPGFASWCKAPDEELCQECFQLGFWVDDP